MANSVDYSKTSPNYTPNSQVRAVYGYPRSVEWITIHWWGDPNSNPTFEGVVSWFSQPRSQVSAHDVITGSGNRVAVMVDYNDAAWHAGNARGNATSLGFECDPRCRPEDYEAVAQDIAETWKYYGRIIPLRKHSYWVSTACPGNYDLSRLQARAMEIYNGVVAPTPPADTRPEWLKNLKKWAETKTLYAVGDAVPLRDLGNAANIVKSYAKGTPFEIAGETKVGNSTYCLTKYAVYNNKGQGFDTNVLQDTDPNVVVVPPPQPEWIRNLVDVEDVKLTVLKAEGTPVINLSTLEPLPSTLIPRGTQVDIAKETIVGDKKFYLTSYSVSRGVSNGILAEDLGVPTTPPVVEKPEWLKNLQDIADKDVWTRSTTPILNLADGTVEREVPVNTKLRITQATEVVGQNLLVLEGGKQAIEVVYASDTEIKNPTDDIEKRLSALEATVKAIVDFLTSIFSGFKAK